MVFYKSPLPHTSYLNPKFEGANVLVHIGIFEVAKGIYQPFMPEKLDHLKRNEEKAKFQFTGHCIGGSIPGCSPSGERPLCFGQNTISGSLS
ncbi:unnamed protein product [Prunus brigantina]